MTNKKKSDEFLKYLSEQDELNEDSEEGDFDLSFYSSYSVIKILKINKSLFNEIDKTRKISKSKFEELFSKVTEKNTHSFLHYDLSYESMKVLLNYSDVEYEFQQLFDELFLNKLDAYKKSIENTRQFKIDNTKNEYALAHIINYKNAILTGNFDENFSKTVGFGFQFDDFNINFHHLKLIDNSIIYGFVPTYQEIPFDLSIDDCIKHSSLLLMSSKNQSEYIKLSKK